jgi:hypothetical protein
MKGFDNRLLHRALCMPAPRHPPRNVLQYFNTEYIALKTLLGLDRSQPPRLRVSSPPLDVAKMAADPDAVAKVCPAFWKLIIKERVLHLQLKQSS